MRGRFVLAASLALVCLVAALPAGTAAAPKTCETSKNDSLAKLTGCVTLAGVREHQAALQAIATANDDTRSSGTPGYEASVDYVVDRVTAAGYDVTVQEFMFPFFEELAPPELQRTAPVPTTYVVGTDFATMTYSGSGNVTAPLKAVDLVLPPTPEPSSTSGCESSDFAGFPAGNVALLQRGTCTFAVKAVNAQAAGASAVLIMNEGQPGRTAAIAGTLGNPVVSIPVLGTSFAVGVDLAGMPGTVVHVKTTTASELRPTWNVFAETTSGRDDNVVMVGAHLDSVTAGPGINDNGSGTATILEVAEQLANVKTKNTVRFAWWGAEEFGLQGSNYYVGQLSDDELAGLALYLNFDMIGSPNYVRFIYDGDGSEFGLEGPAGSGAIEAFFEDFYADRGLASEPSEISFRSDYAAFFNNDIPFGGLFTGAEGVKTAEQAVIYGGTAGVAYDPCYHQACDTYANNSDQVLDVNSDAVAAAVLTYSMNTQDVNGDKGKNKVKAK